MLGYGSVKVKIKALVTVEILDNNTFRVFALLFSAVVSAGLVSVSESGFIKGIWVEVALVLGAVIYGWAVLANFAGAEKWLIHPVVLVIAWNCLNVFTTFGLTFFVAKVPLTKIDFQTGILMFIFTYLTAALFFVSNLIQENLSGL